MAKCRLILVRHGESEGNRDRRFLGHTDLPLTERGHLQAEKTAEFLDKYPVDLIYSSDLRRAFQTGEHIASRKGLSIIEDPVMREIYAGEWEGKEVKLLEKEYEKDYSVWKNNIGLSRCTGGESFKELYARIIPELTRIANENQGLSVCITTHATPIRCARLKAFGFPFERACEIGWTANASVTVIDIDEENNFTMIEDNLYLHLGELSTVLPKNI